MDQSVVDRINELAHLSKERELTQEEKEEQQELRKIFLENFRANFRQQLESIEIVDDDSPKS